MALERISAIAVPPPVHRASHDLPRGSPSAGETVHFALGDAVLDDVFATTADGLSLRLGGLGAMARSLTPGDVLLVRVLATSPRLELALFETPARADGAPTGTPKAMQPDQLAQRQMSWRPPDAGALAQSWRSLVLGQIGQDLRFPMQPSAAAEPPL